MPRLGPMEPHDRTAEHRGIAKAKKRVHTNEAILLSPDSAASRSTLPIQTQLQTPKNKRCHVPPCTTAMPNVFVAWLQRSAPPRRTMTRLTFGEIEERAPAGLGTGLGHGCYGRAALGGTGVVFSRACAMSLRPIAIKRRL